MACAVHRQAEWRDVLPPGLHQRLVGVMDGVLLLHPFPAVAPVLRASIAYEEQDLGLGCDPVQ